MKVAEVIAAHTNTDFDAFAGMVAAGKLYPRARICLTGALNQNVRAFCALHAEEIPMVDACEVDHSAVRRLILIETLDANRLGELGPLLGQPRLDIVAFDHHRPAGAADVEGQPIHLVTSDDGAVTTLMLRIIAERGLPVTPFEASVFALGIHEDTGSLTFASATQRDAEALAFCMRQGASQALIERFLHHPLTSAQREVLAHALRAAESIPAGDGTVMLAAVHLEDYVEEVAVIAHRFLDVTGCDAFFLLVEMEGRVFVVARSRVTTIDVGAALQPVGGGGHAAAASAVVRDAPVSAVRDAVVAGIGRAARRTRTALDVMTHGLTWVDTDTRVDRALVTCHREGLGGLPVAYHDHIVGSVSEGDLRRAAAHGLGHAPVKAVMTSGMATVVQDTPLAELAGVVAASPTGAVPVVSAETTAADAGVRLDAVVGLVRRSDLAGVLRGDGGPPSAPPRPNLSRRLGALGLDDLLAHIQAVATGYPGVYLVGGAVRDLLLRERNLDIDIAVEGDGIEFAEALAARLGGHVRAHPKFQTAVVVAGQENGGEALRVDVASTRTEFYDFPAALPTVEHATLSADLARRDFTMNAMAVSLRGEDFGALYDYFGGMRDLAARRVVVLHNLSFIEDPTRIFRALRYESRYGLRMDAHTYNLARACSEMDLIGDLSSARLRDELVLMLREAAVDFALQRMQELAVTRALHPRASAGPATRQLVRSSDAVWRRHHLAGEVPLWRQRLTWLLRRLAPEEISEWAGRMRFAQADAAVLARSVVVGRRMLERLPSGLSEAALHEAAASEPLEAVVVAMVLDDGGAVAQRLAHYLDHTRFTRLEIGGGDLIALGFRPSPALGRILRSLLRLKVNGVLHTREEEIEAARRMR